MEELIVYLTKIIRKHIDKIGEIESENYNEELDVICSELINLRYKLENINFKIRKELKKE